MPEFPVCGKKIKELGSYEAPKFQISSEELSEIILL